MAQEMNETMSNVEQNLQSAAHHTADMLKVMEQKSEETYAAARARIRERWDSTKNDLGRLRQSAAAYSKSTAQDLDHMAHERPWAAVGIAAGIGLVVGWLLARD